MLHSLQITVDGLIFVGYMYQFSLFSWMAKSMNSSTHKITISVYIMKGNILAMNFEPIEFVILVQSTKIGTHENKAIHSIH